MAPSESKLEDILRTTVEEVYRGENQNDLTVRFVRDKVEHDLGLPEGFFSTPEWKDKSKLLIKSWATKLIEDDERREAAPAPANIETKPKSEKKSSMQKSEPPPKKATTGGSRNAKPPPKKRQRKEETPSEDALSASTEDSASSDFKDSDDSEPAKATRKTKPKPRTQVKRQSKKRAKDESDESEVDSEPSLVDSDEDSEAKPSPRKKAKTEVGNRRQSKPTKIESDEESEEEHESVKTSVAKPGIKPTPTKSEDADEKSPINDSDSDSEAAMVIDGEPKPKQKQRSKSESSSKASKPRAGPKELSSDELQIKTLQSQLTKCGMRKIWGIELKKFAGDDKKKIRHLQGMLRDVGMTGRFSEQRAKEIKELRELQADLEAVTEGDSKWGLQSGKRARAQRKSFKETSDENEDEDGEEDEDAKMSRKDASDAKAARVKNELAFLGDEESGSD